jgi:translation initiation factor IF-3
MVTVESMPKQEGRNMIMVISPNKRYLEQLARAQARQSEAVAGSDVEPAPTEMAEMAEPAPEPEAELAPGPVASDSDEG